MRFESKLCESSIFVDYRAFIDECIVCHAIWRDFDIFEFGIIESGRLIRQNGPWQNMEFRVQDAIQD
jgi:hypothetical protein